MRSNTLALTWLTPLNGLLWSYFTVFLWIVDLEGMKQVCCVSRVSAREWSQIRQATCILLVTAPFSLTGTEVFPHFAFTRCVLSLTEEVEHSSVAIFTVWCLVLVHEHTCLHVWRGGSIYQYRLYGYCISQWVNFYRYITLSILSPTTRQLKGIAGMVGCILVCHKSLTASLPLLLLSYWVSDLSFIIATYVIDCQCFDLRHSVA